MCVDTQGLVTTDNQQPTATTDSDNRQPTTDKGQGRNGEEVSADDAMNCTQQSSQRGDRYAVLWNTHTYTGEVQTAISSNDHGE